MTNTNLNVNTVLNNNSFLTKFNHQMPDDENIEIVSEHIFSLTHNVYGKEITYVRNDSDTVGIFWTIKPTTACRKILPQPMRVNFDLYAKAVCKQYSAIGEAIFNNGFDVINDDVQKDIGSDAFGYYRNLIDIYDELYDGEDGAINKIKQQLMHFNLKPSIDFIQSIKNPRDRLRYVDILNDFTTVLIDLMHKFVVVSEDDKEQYAKTIRQLIDKLIDGKIDF